MKIPWIKLLKLILAARSGKPADIIALVMLFLSLAAKLTSNTWDDDLMKDIEKRLKMTA